MGADAFHDKIQSHGIVAAGGDDDVRVALGRLHEPVVHGLDGGEILVHDVFQIPAAVPGVPDDAPENAHVRVGVHEDLDVHEIAEIGVREDQNALHHQHLGGLHGGGLVGAVVHLVVIYRALDGLARPERLDMLHHKRRIEGVGVVVVELCAFLVGEFIVALVVVIMVQDAHVAAELPQDPAGDGGLAAAGAAGDADHDGVRHRASLPFLYLSVLFYHTAVRTAI